MTLSPKETNSLLYVYTYICIYVYVYMYTNTYVYCACNLMAPVFNQPLWLFSYAYFFLNLLYKKHLHDDFYVTFTLQLCIQYCFPQGTKPTAEKKLSINCDFLKINLCSDVWLCSYYVMLVLTRRTSSIIMFRFFKFLACMHYSTFNNMY